MGLRPTKLNENGSEWSIFEAAAATLPLFPDAPACWRTPSRQRASGSTASARPGLCGMGILPMRWPCHRPPAHKRRGIPRGYPATRKRPNGRCRATTRVAPTTQAPPLPQSRQAAGHGHLGRVRSTGRVPAVPPSPGATSSAALPHAKSAMRNLLCQPVPPRCAPDTTPLRLSARSAATVRVSKLSRGQRSEASSLPIPRRGQISLDKLITL